MREIILDTETTGLDPSKGHRVIEIGCIEVVHRRYSGRTFHVYINPQRPVDEGALAVHGISDEFLQDKPLFETVAQAFLSFIQDARLVIHNAAFDLSFLNAELRRIDPSTPDLEAQCEVIDTLALARKRHPGQKNNLDALCKRYFIDNSKRELHGALLDAQILTDVYLAMTGGQASLFGEEKEVTDEMSPLASEHSGRMQKHEHGALVVVKASEEECIKHRHYLEGMKLETTW